MSSIAVHTPSPASHLPELLLLYQPQLTARDGQWWGIEALVRGKGPYGLTLPAHRVMAQADTPGARLTLTRQVLEQALQDSQYWRADQPHLHLSVNISAQVLTDPALAPWLLSVLQQHRYPARQLTLEITEDQPIGARDASLQTMETLGRAGVRWSVDDFGAGHANLLRLLQLPCQQIKLDRRFVATLGRQAMAGHILRTTSRMARQLGLEVVTEGIETRFQLQQVRRSGAQLLQGYLLGRPMRPQALSRWAQVWRLQQARLWPHSTASAAKAAVSVRSTRAPSPTGCTPRSRIWASS